MLANAMVCVALIALAANAILSTGTISARIAVRRVAQAYAAKEYARAFDELLSRTQTYARAGAFPSPLPYVDSLAADCADSDPPCAISGSATITWLRRDPATPAACGVDSACAANEQINPYVNEGRTVGRISVFVRSAGGTLLAQRDTELTLRTFAAPPYAAMAGSADGTFNAASPGPHGEDAGIAPLTPNPCVFATPGQARDTVVRVAYENIQTGECRDGSAWRTSGY